MTDMKADISQSSLRLRAGPWLPTLQCNSMMALLNAGDQGETHIFTPRELLFSMGRPVFPELSGEALHDCRGCINWENEPALVNNFTKIIH